MGSVGADVFKGGCDVPGYLVICASYPAHQQYVTTV